MNGVHTYRLADLCERYNIDIAEFDSVISGLPPITGSGPWLAGGALRRLLRGDPLKSDWDFFFRDAQQCEQFEGELLRRDFKRAGGTANATTYRGKVKDKAVEVQTIKLGLYASAESVIDSFDFTICQFAYDGETLYAGEYALWDLARSRISVHKITYAAASVRRFLKYQTQGFTVCSGAVVSLLDAVSKDPKLINAEVQYVD